MAILPSSPYDQSAQQTTAESEEPQPRVIDTEGEKGKEKRCSCCKKVSPIKSFGLVNKQYRRKICNRCHRISNMARKHEKDPDEYLAMAQQPCAVCGDEDATLYYEKGTLPVITLCRSHSAKIKNLKRDKALLFYIDILETFPWWAKDMAKKNFHPPWLDTSKKK